MDWCTERKEFETGLELLHLNVKSKLAVEDVKGAREIIMVGIDIAQVAKVQSKNIDLRQELISMDLHKKDIRAAQIQMILIESMELSPIQEIRRLKQMAKMAILESKVQSATKILNDAKTFSNENFLAYQTAEISLDIAQIYLDADIIVEASRTLKEMENDLRYMPRQKNRWKQLNQTITEKTVSQK